MNFPIAQQREKCRLEVARLAETKAPSLSDIRRLRTEFGPELAHQLLEVSRLQTKARAKFGEGIWWVTRRSLQQATPWQVAAIKASWFGTSEVFDLCCGIGGDAMQLALRGGVTGVDVDPLVSQYATENLASLRCEHPQRVIQSDVLDLDLPQRCRIHLDPDRRVHQRRSSRPEMYRPSWPDVLRLITRAEAAVVKLAPAATIPSSIPGSHRCWISLRGSVREQSLICGLAVSQGNFVGDAKSAFIVRSDGSRSMFSCSAKEAVCAVESSAPRDFLIDPDAAIRAAGLTETFAQRHGFTLTGGPSGFLTADSIDVVALQPYCVAEPILWCGGADDRKIRRELRSRDVFPQTIKVRGTGHDPNTLHKRYRQCGSRPITLWFGRSAQRTFAAITDPTFQSGDSNLA
ncbi:MAG: class I SAM-dependent methyltransferase [Pirellulales bacterium]|nr:class I SAM-dependent methyltransferase [Pirellulales bacterium]